MKKNVLFLTLLICMSLLLSACGQTDTPVSLTTTEINGQEAVIDRENCTITCGEDVYNFTVSIEDSSGYSVELEYPNGKAITWHFDNGLGADYPTGETDFDPEEEGYLDDWLVCDVILSMSTAPTVKAPTEKGLQKNPLIALVLIFLGIFNATRTKASWFLNHGWRFKDEEPSDAALFWGRIVGIVLILIGILFLFL